MAQDTFGDFDATSSNNSTIEGDATDGSVDISEGCLPGNINNAIRALMAASNQAFGGLPSGTARPSYLTSGKFWKDTTTAASPIIKYYDGTDDISILTIDHSGNTVALSSSVDVFTSGARGLVPASGGGTLNFLRADGTFAAPSASSITLGTDRTLPAATSDSFTSLPSGLSEIVVMLENVSLTADELQIRIGDSGGIETSGYDGAVATFGGSGLSIGDGFSLTNGVSASTNVSGRVVLSRKNGNEWSANSIIGGGAVVHWMGGVKTLSAELTQVQIRTTGLGNFDNGSWNIQYKS